jgi:hypothetical protein
MQQYTPAQIQPNLKMPAACAQRAQLDKATARLLRRLRCSRLFLRSTQRPCSPTVRRGHSDSWNQADIPQLLKLAGSTLLQPAYIGGKIESIPHDADALASSHHTPKFRRLVP